jgi:hypothetical protein
MRIPDAYPEDQIYADADPQHWEKTSGRQDSIVMNTLGSLDSWTVCHQKVFFAKLFWCLLKVHQEVDSLVYSLQGS